MTTMAHPINLKQPERELEEWQRMLMQQAQVIDGIGKLLADPGVTLADKRALLVDLKTTTANATASLNQIERAQRECVRVREQMRVWGWLV